MADLFRREALDHHTGRGGPGDVLRVAPRWTTWLFWLVVVSSAGAGVAAWFVRIDGERLITVLVGGG
ncbi:MAG TPA: hypothetical protein VF244_07650 [Acidimicrobiales bacterium]